MSRTPSPLPRDSGDLGRIGSGGGGTGCHEWRIGKGSEPESRGFAKWTQNGRLGWWLWNTQRGWMMYIGLLVVFYEGAGFALSKANEFTLLSKLLLHSLLPWGGNILLTRLFIAGVYKYLETFLEAELQLIAL